MIRPLDVWAPHARRVQLEASGRLVAMERDASGWWRSGTRHDGPYWFVVDGDRLPDPRSDWQPEGIRGPSHTVDHAAHRWTDDRWRGRPLASSVLYELHIGTFTPEATFASAIDRLDHLVRLGVDAVEIMPVAQFPGSRGWGYDGVGLFAPQDSYGGPAALKRFVDACHTRGLAVVLDVVYNHLGPTGNHLERFGPYFTERYRTPWGKAVNLDDEGSDEVRRFLCDNALHWLRDYHFDGLRIDAVHALFDQSAQHFLEQLAVEVAQLERAVGRTLWLIAESDLNDPVLVRHRDAHGYGLDAQWSDDFHHAVHAAVTGERSGYYADFGSLRAVAAAVENTFVFSGQRSAHRGHRHGRPVTELPQHRFVVFLQNHDQIGNRALGERLSSLVEPDALFAVAAILILGPFVPMLFQGEEWGASTPFLYFTDHDDPELGAAVREGRRAEFAAFDWDPEAVPDPQAVTTFERSKLDWDEPGTAHHRDLLDWHAEMIRLRRQLVSSFVGGDDRVTVRVDDEQSSVVMSRGDVEVIASLGPGGAVVDTAVGDRSVLAAHGSHVSDGASLRLDAWAVVVLAPGR